MARPPRLVVAGWPLHIVQRGHDRQPIFFCGDDYWKYLHDLKEAALSNECDVHAYVLMTNHVHLLITPHGESSASSLIQDIGRRYVRYINGVYKRSGSLWEGRFKSCLIETEAYLLGCYRYIELNPVRAKMVESPEQYPWSSYHHNAMGRTNNLVTEHSSYLVLGMNEERRQQVYRTFFTETYGVSEEKQFREGVEQFGFVGNEKFRKQIEGMFGRRVKACKHGGDRRSKLYQVV